jgi:hypothetical protein
MAGKETYRRVSATLQRRLAKVLPSAVHSLAEEIAIASRSDNVLKWTAPLAYFIS